VGEETSLGGSEDMKKRTSSREVKRRPRGRCLVLEEAESDESSLAASVKRTSLAFGLIVVSSVGSSTSAVERMPLMQLSSAWTGVADEAMG
jgi:hypothetical protein